MNSFVSYLRDVKLALNNEDTTIKLAMGNTSGDMDSIVGALGMGYYLTLKNKELWTPVVNCRKEDLKLKTEIYCHLIDDCKLSMDDMLFWDELVQLKPKVSEIAIIDHNLLDEAQAEALGDNAHSKVTYIYDHHFDNKFYPESQLKHADIRFIGSAASILVLLMK
jgi:inorganic pyrophosphatase/exopolyphosphatase